MTLSPILRVEDVMVRYGMRDARTARRLMNAAGGFKVGGRLVVREDALESWEVRQARANPRPAPQSATDATRAPRPRRPATPTPVSGPDWWRPEAVGDLGEDRPR